MGVKDLFRPKYKHSDPAVREEAVKALEDQETLTWVAENDPDPWIRLTALKASGGQQALADFALTYSWLEDAVYEDIAAGAAEAITDDRFLLPLALDIGSEDIAIGMAKRIADQDYLYELALRSDGLQGKHQVQQTAIKRIGDQGLLARLLGEVSSPRVALVVARKIRDEEVLVQTAKTTEHDGVFQHCLDRIKDESVFLDIYRVRADHRHGALLIRRIKDKDFLTSLAKNDPDPDTRCRAAMGLDDQELMAETVIKANGFSQAVNLAERINDQACLARIVRECTDNSIRLPIIGRLEDVELLAELVRENGDPEVTVSAVNNPALGDQELLWEVLQTSDDKHVIEAALAKIHDKDILRSLAERPGLLPGGYSHPLFPADLLTEMALHHDSVKKRLAALNSPRFNNTKALIELVTNDEDRSIRLAALAKIDNQDRLLGIAQIIPDENDGAVKRMLTSKIDDPGLRQQLPPAWRPKDEPKPRVDPEDQEVDVPALIMELVVLGEQPGYLAMAPAQGFNDDLRNLRAREIGHILYSHGGKDLMMEAAVTVQAMLGPERVAELNYAWNRVGSWYA